jgi:hypothetical protein
MGRSTETYHQAVGQLSSEIPYRSLEVPLIYEFVEELMRRWPHLVMDRLLDIKAEQLADRLMGMDLG